MLRSSLTGFLKTRIQSAPVLSPHGLPRPQALPMRWYSEKIVSPTITFEELKERIEQRKPDSASTKPFALIDVREPSEFGAGAIPTALNVPLSQLADAFVANHDDFEDKLGFEKPSPSDEIIVYCKAGVRSSAAGEYLRSLGYSRVRNYPGSYMEWESMYMK